MPGESRSVDSLLEGTRTLLSGIIISCSTISVSLCAPVTDDLWPKFGQLVRNLEELHANVRLLRDEPTTIMEQTDLHQTLVWFVEQLENRFNELNQWMDAGRYVCAADCMRFELMSLFQHFIVQLGESQATREQRFANNLSYIQHLHPDVYQSLVEAQAKPITHQIAYSRNGSANLYVCAEDGQVRALYSHYNPEHEVQQWLSSVRNTIVDKDYIILYGIGLGYHLAALVREYPAHKLVIFEPDVQVLVAAMQLVDVKQWFIHHNIEYFLVGSDKEARRHLFTNFAYSLKGDTALASLPVYDKIFPQDKTEYFGDVKRALQNYSMAAKTLELHGLELFQNRVYNLSHLLHSSSMKGLVGKLTTYPAVVVGAGPSLGIDAEYLRQLQHHALIIAAGTAVQSLSHYGVKPHLVVSIDFSKYNEAAFEGLDLDEVPFLYAPQLKYTILKNKKKLMYLLPDNELLVRHYLGILEMPEEELAFTTTPSVTGNVIEAAIYMGCTEIIFTGQDFSYPNDQMYSAGAKHVGDDRAQRFIEAAQLQVENVSGGMNRTNVMMQVTLNAIEGVLAQHPDVRFINTSSVGAKIQHTEWESLESVLHRHEALQVQADVIGDAMRQHLSPPDEGQQSQIIERLHGTLEDVELLDSNMKRIKKKLGSLEELSRRKPQKCVNMMVDIEEMWSEITHNTFFQLVISYALFNTLGLFDRYREEVAEEQNLIRKAEMFVRLLGNLISDVEKVLPQMRRSAENALRRIDGEEVPEEEMA